MIPEKDPRKKQPSLDLVDLVDACTEVKVERRDEMVETAVFAGMVYACISFGIKLLTTLTSFSDT